MVDTERKLRKGQGSNFKNNESVLRNIILLMIKPITPKINCNHFPVNDLKRNGSTDTMVKNSHFV